METDSDTLLNNELLKLLSIQSLHFFLFDFFTNATGLSSFFLAPSAFLLSICFLCFFCLILFAFFLQFYLQDTKSSNGTFINSQRLSRGSEESPPCEVLSGDIIQFGVDVTENTRKGQPRVQPVICSFKRTSLL